MKIQTIEQLSTFLRGDLAWRRKEMRVLDSLVKGAVASKQQAVLRGAVAALYAHWEGFIKTASDAYIDYVRLRALTIGELRPNFIGLLIRGRVQNLATSGGAREFTEFVEWLIREWNLRAHLPKSEKLSTQSNLNVAVFKEIVNGVGLPYRDEYSRAEKTVIEPLVRDRNHLAHGEWQIIEQETFERYFMWIDRLLVIYCDDIEEAAATSLYKRPIAGIS